MIVIKMISYTEILQEKSSAIRENGGRNLNIILLTSLNIKSNPMIQMYISSLKKEYDLTVSCKDYDCIENKELGVHLVPDGLTILDSHPIIKKISMFIESKINIRYGKKIHYKFCIRYFRKNICQLLNKNLYKKNTKCIIAVDGETLFTAKILSKILRVPYIYVAYEIWPNQFKWYSKDQIGTMEYLENKYISSSACTIVVNKRWADLIRRRYKSKTDFKIVTVAPKKSKINANLIEFKSSDILKIHYHGAIVPGRGVEELIYAMNEVSGAKLYFRPVGKPELIEELKKYVEENNLHNKIEFLNPVSMKELVKEGSKYDVGVVIAKNETLQGRMVTGFKLFEYMSSGLAIIAPKSYPINNIFKEGEIGAFYKETTASEIAKTIRYLVEHPEKVNKMKKESYNLSIKKYNFEKQSEELLRIINQF